MNQGNAEWQRLSALFDELADLPFDESHRRVEALAATEPALAARLLAMLAADHSTSGVLDHGVEAVAPTVVGDLARSQASDEASGPPPPQSIGRFRLIRLLGRGGMGEVYLAESTQGDFVQQVALKLLKRGMDSDDILRRFTQERRILAQLNHPNIARLVDGGVSEQGRPYYAMEYVDGLSLTDFARQHALDVHARVRLVVALCTAVAHAQTRLVVHRDLKPSNVLVDASGQPHVLDFGIAKILGDTGDDSLTRTGARALSPAYAAPEQMTGEPVSTATDVYALGVILYELLSGQLPHARSSTTTTTFSDETLERPSQSLRHARKADSTQTYGTRHADRDRHARSIAGDLDTIVLTALKRDPERRYANAAALGDDLGRWLAGRTVKARPDSATYRAIKFIRRNRIAVAASALVALSLIGGFGAALWQAQRAQAAAQLAEQQSTLATQQAQRAERVKEYLLSLFREQDPLTRAQAQQRTASELIVEGLRRAESLKADPVLYGAVRNDLAEVQFGLGDFKAAREVFEQVLEDRRRLLGPDSPEVGLTLANLAGTLMAQGESKQAEALVRDAVRILRASRGVDDIDTARAESRLVRIELEASRFDEALGLARHVIDVYKSHFGAGHAEVGPPLYALAVIYEQLDRLADAEAAFGESLAITVRERGADHLATVYPRTLYGDILRRTRKYPEAEAAYRQSLATATAQLPANHAMLGKIRMRLGDLQRRQGKYAEAVATLETASVALLAVNAPEYAQVQQILGRIAEERGDFSSAIPYYRNAYAHFEKTVGNNVYTWGAAGSLAVAMARNGDLAGAETLARKASAAMSVVANAQAFDSVTANATLGEVLHLAGKHEEAIALLRKSLQGMINVYGEAHGGVAEGRLEVAVAMIDSQDPALRAEAGQLLEQASPVLLADETAKLRVGELLLAQSRLAAANGNMEGAQALRKQAIERLRRDRGDSHPYTRLAMQEPGSARKAH